MSSYIPSANNGSSLGINNVDLKVLNNHFLNESGDSMRGTLSMNYNQIKDVGEAVDDSDAVNKKQVNGDLQLIKDDIKNITKTNILLTQELTDANNKMAIVTT